jgi:hypothetical protein
MEFFERELRDSWDLLCGWFVRAKENSLIMMGNKQHYQQFGIRNTTKPTTSSLTLYWSIAAKRLDLKTYKKIYKNAA